MKQITFHIETLTPMFMSGEDQGKFELRPPSFKGLLRFWWRAYYWGKNSIELTPEEIEKEEGKIFGTSSGNGRKSRFALRIQIQQIHRSNKKFPPPNGHFLFKYLTYGTQCKAHDGTFNIRLNIFDAKVEKDIVLSVYLLSVFGAIGAKSRNGFGNFVVKKPEIFQAYNLPYPFPTPEFLNTLITNENMPNFTALSKNVKIFKLRKPYKSSEKCHAQLGQIYKESKSELDEPLSCRKRQYIAAPIVVRKRGESRPYDESLLSRHAKPYYLRVVHVTPDRFEGYILYFPSKYCEELGTDVDHDRRFLQSCEEFNECLLKKGMEVYYE